MTMSTSSFEVMRRASSARLPACTRPASESANTMALPAGRNQPRPLERVSMIHTGPRRSTSVPTELSKRATSVPAFTGKLKAARIGSSWPKPTTAPETGAPRSSWADSSDGTPSWLKAISRTAAASSGSGVALRASASPDSRAWSSVGAIMVATSAARATPAGISVSGGAAGGATGADCTAAAVFGAGCCGLAQEAMLREAQRIPVTPTREEVLDIGAEYCAAPDRATRAEDAEATGRMLASPPVQRPGIRAGGRAALGLPSLGLACWLACAGLSACTGSSPREQRYGQDAGADFDAPAATGGAGGSAAGGTGGDTPPATGGTAGTSAGG